MSIYEAGNCYENSLVPDQKQCPILLQLGHPSKIPFKKSKKTQSQS